MNASMHSCIQIFIYIAFYIHISLYYLYIISFMRFYHDLAIHVLSIFLSCKLLLIHIFIYVPIFHVHVLILVLRHLLLTSIVLIIYAFLSCVPSMFHLIPFGMSIICVLLTIISYDMSYHIFSYLMTYTYHILYVAHTCSFSYLFHLLLCSCSCSCSYFISFSCFISYSCFLVPL